jgi:hypothetical protein
MVRVELYDQKRQTEWDGLVARAKNGVFLFHRSYMEYHADRFTDHSLLFFDGDKLLAILPANRAGTDLVSHGGLTFGGFVTDDRMKAPQMLRLFDALLDHCRVAGLTRVVYKVVPHIYHRHPAAEDLYALFVREGRLVRRDVSATIDQRDRIGPNELRRRGARRARANGLEIRPSADFAGYMEIVAENLRTRHDAMPTHSGAEMKLLADRHPDQIKLYGAYRGNDMMAGVVVYENPRVAHAQYIASTAAGRELSALDCVFEGLINEMYAATPYFDFGISTEDGGRHLNVGLIDYKESYGARAVAYDWYEVRAA